MKTFYVIRSGWNSANQSSMYGATNPRNQFESKQYMLVAIVDAESAEKACEQFEGSVYNGQHIFATANPRSVKGLTAAIEQFNAPCY